jgi:hypothetical protein
MVVLLAYLVGIVVLLIMLRLVVPLSLSIWKPALPISKYLARLYAPSYLIVRRC